MGVELSNSKATCMMQDFARRYPWDWAADIGEVPPREHPQDGGCNLWRRQGQTVLDSLRASCEEAAVVGPTGEIVSRSADERPSHGANETMSAVMMAIGKAGSAVNIRECALVFAGRG